MTALIRGMSSSTPGKNRGTRGRYLIFEVTLNREANKEVRVDYVTVDGTAVAGRDYEPKSGTLVFGRRDLTKTIWVPVEFDAAEVSVHGSDWYLQSDRPVVPDETMKQKLSRRNDTDIT